MNEYDVTLKLLLQGSADLTMRLLAGEPVRRWLNVELPEIQITRMDLLGEKSDGGLVHIELQSGNDREMALRMAEYCLRVYRRTSRFPRQVVLYVGDPPVRMSTELVGPGLRFHYELINVKDLDGEGLLRSSNIGDNIFAILTNLPDMRAAVRLVLARIAELQSASERETVLRQFMILAGLRKAEELVSREAEHVPITKDFRDHKIYGPIYRDGYEKGRLEGEARGLLKGEREGEVRGEREGELKILLLQIERRFGRLPARVKDDLAKRSSQELEELSLRVLDAQSLDDFLK